MDWIFWTCADKSLELRRIYHDAISDMLWILNCDMGKQKLYCSKIGKEDDSHGENKVQCVLLSIVNICIVYVHKTFGGHCQSSSSSNP